MTSVRQELRPIMVGDTAYRWTVRRRTARHRAEGCTLLTFVAEQDTGQNALLLVNLPAAPALPSTVADGITRALAAGWRPGSRGPVPQGRPWLQRRQDPGGSRPPVPARHAGLRRRD